MVQGTLSRLVTQPSNAADRMYHLWDEALGQGNQMSG